ncbi:hypothetical protein [Streptomyces sp. NBC_01240]|uniref:hypothetical protein n=2 Tax=unclassified Streptomyces TaxID=2593676 RepID=UPI002E1190BD|nr:hypothetical protein OG466_01590 [Streptomyces sp. NBC_01240]
MRRALVHLELSASDHLRQTLTADLERYDLIIVAVVISVGTSILSRSGRKSIAENAAMHSNAARWKVIAEAAPAATEPDPPQTETSTAYQAIVNAFNQHAGQMFRARELHELLDLPTDEASVNITRSRLARLLRQRFLTQPGRGRYQKRT